MKIYSGARLSSSLVIALLLGAAISPASAVFAATQNEVTPAQTTNNSIKSVETINTYINGKGTLSDLNELYQLQENAPTGVLFDGLAWSTNKINLTSYEA